MSSDSVDNWIVGFMTALAPGLAHLASDFQMVDTQYDSLSDVGEIRVYLRADFQSGSRVLKKVF